MAKCPNCNKEVGDVNYCPNCGTKMPEEKEDFEKKVDEFFEALESASQEDRDEFFRLLQEELDKAKKN